jgi:hypothetical protein
MPRRFPDGLPAITPLTLARLQRRLPAPGDLTVHVGSRVEPDDLIGRCSVQPERILLHVAAELSIEPAEIQRYVRHNVGTRVAFRDVIARRGQHNVTAPMAGFITEIDTTTGFVVLTPEPVPASVPAMLRGYVIAIDDGQSATIETPAAVFRGAVGFGDEQWGTLRVLVERPDQPIVPSLIDAHCAFGVLIGGGITLEALRAATKEQVKAIIVGSVDVDVLRAFWGERWARNWRRVQKRADASTSWDDGPAVVLTEGWGRHAMNERLFEGLARLHEQEAYVDATTSLHAPQRRPRIIVPLPYTGMDTEEATHVNSLQPGVTVRLLNESHMGATARLNHMEPQGRLRSGVRTATATVEFANGEQATVPVSALDILG